MSAAVGAECGENGAREDGAVVLDPPGHVLVPTSDLVSLGRIAVGGVVSEEMWCGHLVGVVDPVWQMSANVSLGHDRACSS